MVAVGDSITAAFNSGGAFAQRQNSWSTGHEIDSHFSFLSERFDFVKAKNFAISGSRSGGLLRQVNRVIRRLDHVDYVTLLIGANDVCAFGVNVQTPLEKFRTRIGAALFRLVRAYPDVKILVPSLPNIERLYEIGEKYGCQPLWERKRICRKFLNSNVSDKDREKFMTRWDRTNQILKEEAEKFPENAFFSPAMASFDFEMKHVSKRDCFHPSVAGQEEIALNTWHPDWLLGR